MAMYKSVILGTVRVTQQNDQSVVGYATQSVLLPVICVKGSL
jgi:hypothetical protein